MITDYKGYVIVTDWNGEHRIKCNGEVWVFKSINEAKRFIDWSEHPGPPKPSGRPHLCEIVNLGAYKKKGDV